MARVTIRTDQVSYKYRKKCKCGGYKKWGVDRCWMCMRADSIKMKKLPIAPCIEQMYPKEVLLRVDYGQAVEIVCEAATQRMRFLGRNSSMRDGEFHSRQEELKEAIGLINACKITPAVEPCSGSRGQAARIE